MEETREATMEVKVDAPVPPVPEKQHADKKFGTIDLRWKDLSYSIAQGKTDRRTVLHAQDGMCKGGELMAFMGPSGSGKTSLLNALAGRLPQQKGAIFSGELCVNELPMQDLPCPFADISAYVEQEDVLYALSTVTETLRFQAKLRLPKSFPQEEANKRIETILRQVGLNHVRNTNVGGSSFNGAIRGLSGGERKRLSIALELLHDPQVLFLDEPTTGLDSYQALNVMEKLRDLANAHQTVVVSIHQPRSSIFAMLDSVIILAAGRPAFAGPIEGATKHFEDQGYLMPPKFNPADFFIDLVSVDQRDVDEEKKTTERLQKVCDLWQDTQLQLRHGAVDTSGKTVEELNQEILARKPEQPAGQTALVGPLVQLLIRGWREQTRDKVAMTIKNVFQLFFTMVFGLVYFRLGYSQQNVQDRNGILFFLTMNQAFGAVIGCAQAIPRQLVVVTRERANRLYTVLPFYLSTLFCLIPLEIIPQMFTNLLIFYMTNLGGSFWTFFMVLALENFAGLSLGIMLSACFSNVTMAAQIAPAVVILFLMFSGFLINEDSVPVYFVWLKEISFIRYAFKAVAVNEFADASFDCNLCPIGPISPDDECDLYCVNDGQQVLKQLNFDQDNLIFNCVMILIGFGVIVNALALLILTLGYPKFLRLQGEGPKLQDAPQQPKATDSKTEDGVEQPKPTDSKTEDVVAGV